MKIEITSQGKLIDLETKLNLGYYRKRIDYKNLLISIKEGKSLLGQFPKSIANSISKRLIELKYIDNGGNLTEEGNKMIDNPELLETETGAYSVKIMEFKLGDTVYNLIPEIRRKLSQQRRELVDYSLNGYEIKNHIILDDEIVRFISMDQQEKSNKVFISEDKDEIVVKIDLEQKIYEYGSKALELGSSLSGKLIKLADDLLNDNPYGKFDFSIKKFIISNGLKNLAQEEIIIGEVKQFKKDYLLIENAKFIIDDEKTAYEYLYRIAYDKLQKDSYYTLDDLNDIYINEIFNSGIFTENIKKQIVDFTYDMNGFSSYLPKKEYESLQYKLNVLAFLLDFTLVTDDFNSVTDYVSLAKTFNTFVPSNKVKECYVVMGYPFAKNKRNRFNEFYHFFSNTYKNVYIIKKGNSQTEDYDIIKEFEKQEIPIYDISSLKEYYHDRYIIFKMNDDQYKIFLLTSEIGQFFKLKSNEKMGLIKELDYKEIEQTNKNNNLLRLIERGILND